VAHEDSIYGGYLGYGTPYLMHLNPYALQQTQELEKYTESRE
jgi:hypothetical protein